MSYLLEECQTRTQCHRGCHYFTILQGIVDAILEFQFKNVASLFTVDGGWSDWIDSPCDAQCGPGKQNRTRTCNNPPPSGGGNDCLGSAVETVDCNNAPCVGKLL